MKKNKKIGSFLQRTTAADHIILIFLVLFGLTTLYPFYQTVLLSFADAASALTHPIYLLPYSFELVGYEALFQDNAFWRSLQVTVFVTVVGTALSMILTVLGGYVLSRKYLMGRRTIMNLIIFTMFFGGGQIPSYIINKELGFVNNIWVMIIPCAMSTYNMIIVKNYFLNLPDGLLEAARIDGANELTILLRVAIPLSLPIVATFSLFYAVDRWNEWGMCNLYINEPSLYPLQFYLRDMLNGGNKQLSSYIHQKMLEAAALGIPYSGIGADSLKSAAMVVATVPILCVYPFIQKHFVKGIMVGGLKE